MHGEEGSTLPVAFAAPSIASETPMPPRSDSPETAAKPAGPRRESSTTAWESPKTFRRSAVTDDVVVVGKRARDLLSAEERDDEMDQFHASLLAELASGRMALPVTMEMTLVARFYERLGDHAVNIARRVIYLAGSQPPQ